MLFLQFVQYSLSFAGTPKNEIPGAALGLCQLKIKQLGSLSRHSQIQHKARWKSFCFKLFYGSSHFFVYNIMQARVGWILIIFGTQVIKKKRPVRPVFPDYLSVSYDYVFT